MSTSKRSFITSPHGMLAILLAGALVIALAVWICFHGHPRPRASGAFTILQVNDLYRIEGIADGRRGGLARLRTLRERLKAEGKPVLVLHAGDLLGPSVMSKYMQSRQMIHALNALDGDPRAFDNRLVATFGNHEFDEKTPDLLLARLLESDFRWVSSHVRYQPSAGDPSRPFGRRLDNVVDHVLVDLDGIRVGIVGVTIASTERPWLDYGVDGKDESERNQRICQALTRLREGGAQVLVALTHQSIDADRRLAKNFHQFDLIVGGHEHIAYQGKEGPTWITKADADAISANRIDVEVCKDGSVHVTPDRVPLDVTSPYPPDPNMSRLVEEDRKAFETFYEQDKGKKLSTKQAEVSRTMEGTEPAIRRKETALGDWLADAMREEAGKALKDSANEPIALLQGGSIRLNDDIEPSSGLTNEHLEGIFYFDSDLVQVEVPCEHLLALLDNSVSKADEAEGRFLQVSGVRFCYRFDPGSSKFHVEAEDVAVATAGAAGAWEPLCQRPEYRIVTLRYLCEKGYTEGFESVFPQEKDEKKLAARCQTIIDPSDPQKHLKWRAVTEAWLARQEKPKGADLPTLDQTVDGRITRLDDLPGRPPTVCPVAKAP